jgi:hypothetical protein
VLIELVEIFIQVFCWPNTVFDFHRTFPSFWLWYVARSLVFVCPWGPSWIFIVLAHWNNSLQIDMSPHSDTLSWFRANQYLLFLRNASFLAQKQQIPFSLVWSNQGLNTQCMALEVSMLYDHVHDSPIKWFRTTFSNLFRKSQRFSTLENESFLNLSCSLNMSVLFANNVIFQLATGRWFKPYLL